MYQINEQFFTFKKIVFYLKRYWWLLLLFVFVGMSMNSKEVEEKTYKASKTLLMNWDKESGIQMKVTDSRYPIGDCIQLIESYQMLEEVNSRLIEKGLEPISDLHNVVDISRISESNCFTLSVIGKEQEYAETLIEMLVSVFQDQIKEYYPYLRLLVIKESTELIKTSPGWLRRGVLVLAGLLFGIAIILVLYFLDHRIYSSIEVEQYFKMPYLGQIKNNQGAEELSIILNYKAIKGGYIKLNFLDLENVAKNVCEEVGEKLSVSWDKTDKKNLISFLGLDCSEKDSFVFLIRQCQTKRTDVQSCLESLACFDKVVLGYILIL